MKGAKEFDGRSLDDAIEAACKYYELPREKLEIEIINDAKSGIFGLVGAKKAKILAREASVSGYADLNTRDEEADKSQNRQRQPKQRQPRERRPRNEEGGSPKEKPDTSLEKLAGKEADQTDLRSEAAEAPAATGTAGRRNPDREKAGRDSSRPGQGNSRRNTSDRREAREGEQGQRTGRRPQREQKSNERRPGGKPEHVQAFESEFPSEHPFQANGKDKEEIMDFSMDFESQANLKTLDQIDQDKALELVKSSLEQLLKPICDTPDIGVAIADGRIEATINNKDESGLIIGREGQTLSALQYMVSRIISRQMEAAVHVHLDTGDYKERQDQKLEELALRLAARAKESGRTQYTRPLSSYHRRIVHMVLQSEEEIETRSRGDGPMKRVYIFTRQERN